MGQKLGFPFLKKLDFFFKIGDDGKFALEWETNSITSQKHQFNFSYETFLQKNQKLEIWRNNSQKKRFHPFKWHP